MGELTLMVIVGAVALAWSYVTYRFLIDDERAGFAQPDPPDPPTEWADLVERERDWRNG